MTVQIALLRGVNVGGHNRLPMADFRALLTDLGAQNVSTYIQSGNAVFLGELTDDQIGQCIEKAFGFRPTVMLRDAPFWEATIAAAPADAPDPKALHLFVLGAPTQATEGDLNAHGTGGEQAWIGAGAVYLHTPAGLSASTIAPRMDRLLGVPTTARTWRTVRAIQTLAQALTP